MYDVMIVGSGIVGLVNACMLAQHTDLRIGLLAQSLSPVWSPIEYDARVLAITPASQRIFGELGIWSFIESKRISPFTHMRVWDAYGSGKIHFNHSPALGFIVEENLIRAALYEKLITYSHVEILSDNRTCRLLIGADGAHSMVREKANIAMHTHDYHHTAIIAKVQTELPHQKTAWQCFLGSSGSLAFLPLSHSHECSIVWSTTPEEAALFLSLDETAFSEKITQAFSMQLGTVKLTSKLYSFPLHERHVKNYVKEGLALIGDAAHTLHPLAGQGVNLGIADAACLAKVIISAVNKKRDFSSLHTLRRYERNRKGHNAMMLIAVKTLKALFTSDQKSLQFLRNQGLSLTDQAIFLKKYFSQYAMGTHV